MRRLLLIPIALLGIVTAGASASGHQATRVTVGKILSLTPTSIAVGRQHHHLHCDVTSSSPATAAFGVGDRVRIDCVNRVLVAIADRPAPSKHGDNAEPATAGISGTVTGIDSGSITVHDGDRNLTCTVGTTSPGIAGYNLGDHVKIACADGVLVSIGKPDGLPLSTSARASAGASGPIITLGPASITVQSLTCTLTSSSPKLGDYKIGDLVRIGCLNGSLAYIVPAGSTSATSTTSATTTSGGTTVSLVGATGTITALDTGSITIHNSEHDLTCAIGQSSPATGGFSVGSLVRMYCQSGSLYFLAHSDTAQPATTTTTTTVATTTTTTTPSYTDANGTLTALSGASITVAALTCTIGPASPSTAGFSSGNSVRMYCQNGVLFQLKHNDSPPVTTTTTATTTGDSPK
jgi:hypothetical protein